METAAVSLTTEKPGSKMGRLAACKEIIHLRDKLAYKVPHTLYTTTQTNIKKTNSYDIYLEYEYVYHKHPCFHRSCVCN